MRRAVGTDFFLPDGVVNVRRLTKVSLVGGRIVQCKAEMSVCFSWHRCPQGRKGTLEILLANQEKQNRIIDALQAKALNNYIVQLMYGLCHAKVVAMIDSATSLYPGRHLLRFEDVLEDPRVDKETKDLLKRDRSYAALNRIMNHQFWMVVRTRNNEAHPPFIDLQEIQMMFDQVEPGLQHLSPISQRAFSAAKYVYEKVKSIDKLDELIETFNEA